MTDRVTVLEQALKECITEEGAACFVKGSGVLRRKRLLAINEIAKKALNPPKDPNQLTEGWVSLLNSKKFHYVRDGRTLCGKFLYLGGAFTPDAGWHNPDDCPKCSKSLRAKQSKEKA